MSSIADRVEKSCVALFCAGQVSELRILGVKGRNGFVYNASGWFNDTKKLVAAAMQYEPKAPSGIYVTINPLLPACIARTDNYVIERSKESSSDKDVLRRNWIPLDFDPVRPAGVSSTDEELKLAADLSNKVTEWMIARGFASPLTAHSGNGIHSLLRVDLPNNDESRQLVKNVIEVISAQFSTDRVKIDRTMFNASRIIRLWGTATRKGENNSDRPHRYSKMWGDRRFADFIPNDVGLLKTLIEEFAEPAKATAVAAAEPAQRPASGPIRSKVDLEEFIHRNGIEYTRCDSFDGTGIKYVLTNCLFDSSHGGSSAVIGRGSTGSIFYKCHHDSCSARQWKDVRKLFDKNIPGLDASPPAADADKPEKPKGERKKKEPEHDGPSPWDMAMEFISHLHETDEIGQITIRRHHQKFYIYLLSERKYVHKSDDSMKVEVTRWLGENGYRTNMSTVRDVMNSISSIVTVPESLTMPFLTHINPETKCVTADPIRRQRITLRNGILDLDALFEGAPFSKCLLPHTSEWFCTTALPFDFPCTPEQEKCELFERFMDETFDGDKDLIAVVQEMFGYCFWPDCRLEKYFILQGAGNNGKSTTLDLLQAMIGEDNFSSLSIDQLGDQQMVNDIKNKMANICTDLEEGEDFDEGVLKRIASGEHITGNPKYRDPLKFKATAKMIFSCNPLPRFKDTTLGTWRRVTIIPFDNVVPEDRIDVNLKHKLSQELPGIFIWAMRGAVRLRMNNRFTDAARCVEVSREHRAFCFPVLSFLDECTLAGGHVRISELWMAYKAWCQDVGLSKVRTMHSFARDAVNFLPNISRPKMRCGLLGDIVLHGIQLKIGVRMV